MEIRELLGALRGEDAGDAGEVVRYGDVVPVGGVQEGLDGGEAVVAEFQDEQATGLERLCCLGDEFAVEFVAFLAAVEGSFRFVFADFDGERVGFAAGDVGRI